jgi:hypothetical protein
MKRTFSIHGKVRKAMKNRYGALLLTPVLLVAACLAQTGEDGNAAPLMRVTVAPPSETPIWVRTSPNAKCTLHPDGLDDEKHSLKLYADAEGMVRFLTRSAAESDVHAKLVLLCQSGETTTIHPIELRSAYAPTSDMPAPVVPTTEVGIPRPALSGDPMAPSNDELQMMGYPPRPDPQKAPKAYANWLRMISKPATFVPPQMVASNSFAGPTTQLDYSNWNGFELRTCSAYRCPLTNDTSPYWWITGQWYVPSVTGEYNAATYSALWIGLDGDLTLGLNNLIQAGTEQDAFNIFGFTVSVYQVWTEWWPAQSQQFISNFPVNPRDEILTYVWLSHYSTTDLFVAYIFDLTTSHYTAVNTLVPTGKILGDTAEWIMERPYQQQPNGAIVYPDLADYGIAGMSNTEAVRVNGNYVTYNGSVNAQIEMFNNNDELSAVYPVDATDMLFVWLAFH